jgi:hypothetical protein
MVAVAAAPRPTAQDRIKAALWFAERGFGVFTVWSTEASGACRCPKGRACDNAGKHPIGHQGFKEWTTDPERIRKLLSAGSEPNYGLVCPDGVFALDVDGEGIAKLAELEANLGPLPPTLRTATANGQHVFLRWPADKPRPIGQLFGYVTRWGSGTNAGYVIGPRSVHATGAVYQPAGPVYEVADIPEAWVAAILDQSKTDDAPFIEIESGGYQLPDYGYTGARYDAILRYTASRYMRGISQDEVWAGVLNVLAPRFEDPLTEHDLRSRFERTWSKTAERLGQPVDFGAADTTIGAAAPALPGWPEPLGQKAYHGVAGDIARVMSPITEADPAGILTTLLATAGACMGHGAYIYQGSAQSTNIFAVLVGETASGRKGTAGSLVRHVVSEAYPEWEKLVVAGLGSGEGLIAHLKRNEDIGEHRAIVMESEFGRLLTVMAREGSTLSPVVRDAWDGVPMGRFLAREQSLVTYHHVGIVAHITPVELRAKLNGTDAANGFGNRFLWFAVRRTRLVPFPKSPGSIITPYVADLRRALVAAQTGGEVVWSTAAAERWEWLYATLTSRPLHGITGAMAARAEAQITRLALLYALLDEERQIDTVHLEAAEAIWAFNERTVAYLFGASTGNRDADMLRDYLADGPLDWEAAKKAVGVRRAADLREAVELLSSLGAVEVVTQGRGGGGRPRRLIQLVAPKSGENGAETLQTVQTVQAPGTETTA